jgi:hypothetical protein
MTPDQAASVCAQYQPSNNSVFCAGFWYDQKKPQPASAPSQKRAPCNIGVETVTEGSEWHVTGLTGDCYLKLQGDPTGDALGGCGYGGDDNQCCPNPAKDGTCTNVFKQCGHIFLANSVFTFKTCGGDSGTIGASGKLATLFHAANGNVACADNACQMEIYPNRYQYHFYSQFKPTSSKGDCAHDDSALLGSSDEPNLPIAVQMAYHYMPKQATGDHNDQGAMKCEDTIDYATAWKNCMLDSTCWTFEYNCPTDPTTGSSTCAACSGDSNMDPNHQCGSKFPSVNTKFCYSSQDYKNDIHKDTSGNLLTTMAVYRKIHPVRVPQDSDPITV